MTNDNNDINEIENVYIVRQRKLKDLRKKGFNFPNNFKKNSHSNDLQAAYNDKTKEELLEANIKSSVAGRIVLKRMMGKASFFHIQDNKGRIQIYLRQDENPSIYALFEELDLGDIVGVEGFLFKTKSGELTIHAQNLVLLTKSLQPLPDKFHGLTDQELKYRKRYVDLIANEETRKVFIMRSQIVRACRNFMENYGFLEVETPMMHPIPGGAIARPFITHHHTLKKDLFLRIAPELYLKRLIVGGFEKVFEINRNFRNEGISTRHNPEFTMMEFYQAYADYKDLISFTEDMFKYICDTVLSTRVIEYGDYTLDFDKPFACMTVKEAILFVHKNIDLSILNDADKLKQYLKNQNLEYTPKDNLEKLQMILFEETVEDKLINPTFITEYPTIVSPLARKNEENSLVTDRFELFIAGREIANGFSELNDAEDQASRFKEQVLAKDAGDAEAMHFDSDYIEALEYGMPPTAGEGIGIDRLVMLFTNAPSIRDVILFPHCRDK